MLHYFASYSDIAEKLAYC